MSKAMEDLYKELQEERDKNHELRNAFCEYSHRLKGITIIVESLSLTKDYSDESSVNSAYSQVSEIIHNIVVGMESF